MICRRLPPNRLFVLTAACGLVVAPAADRVQASNVVAALLDGTSATGELRAWTYDTVSIATLDGERQIATKQLVSLHWQSSTAATPSPIGTSRVELIDGSILPITSIHVAGPQAAMKPALSAGEPLNLPITQVSLVQFRQLEGDLANQWDEMRRQNVTSDVIAVVKKNGNSIDYAEGVVGDITDDKIEFKLEGETQRVDRAKIAGVVFYRPDRRMKEEPRAVIQGRSGLRASAAHIELKGDHLAISTSSGLKLSWPLEDIAGADFSAGKLLYLSDIEPASFKWTPLIGLPSSATIAGEYGQLRRDKSAYGGPLSLVLRDPNSASADLVSRTFNKGLALRSRTELSYRLPPGFHRLMALAGIDPATSATGNVRLAISGDDRPLLETEIAGDQQPQPIQLDISNVKRLKILVDYGQNLDTGDWLNLCEARIAK